MLARFIRALFNTACCPFCGHCETRMTRSQPCGCCGYNLDLQGWPTTPRV